MTLKYSLAVLKGKIEYYKRTQRGEQPALEKDITIKHLAGKHMEKAGFNLVVANLLWNISEDEKLKKVHSLNPKFRCYESVIEAAYYAMYHAAMAALARIGYKVRPHEAAVWALYYYYVHEGILEERLVDMLDKARSLKEEYVDMLAKGRQTRRTAAYEVGEISRDLAEDLLSSAKQFVKRLGEVFE
ncbi:hypothetical protein HYU18_03265 [Candidatus Woesearchaeota archaeon]|nr:hypothetical protein [Candidatus Woesearchaeota archaeon]